MAALGEDRYTQLKSAVDTWAAEVSEIRSTLADKLKAEAGATRPALRLHRERAAFMRTTPARDPAKIPDTPRRADADIESQRIRQELEFAREQLLAVAREAEEARGRAEQKSEQMEEMARALGRARLELNEALEQLRSKEWALLETTNENSSLRGDPNAEPQARTVPVDDYDALVESHMSIRAEAAALQELVIRREHEIIALRDGLAGAQAELAAWESMGPTSGAGIAKLAGVIAERSAALEHIEGTVQGQELLIGALRQELGSVRGTLERKELDHDRLTKALRIEVDALRALSSERDFVIGHQAEAIESTVFRDGDLKAELADARELCETLRGRAQQASDERESIGRELQLLRAKLAERESEVWRLRGVPRAAMAAEPGLAQLQAALAARDSELERARQRIAFLRGQGRESAGLAAMAEAFAAEPVAPSVSSGDKAVPGLDLAFDEIQVNFDLQREVEQDLAGRFPWHLIAVIGGIAGLGLLSLGLLALILA